MIKRRSIKFFLDTNIFAYCFDASHKTKQDIARGLVYEAHQSGRGYVSWQVAQEFISLATRKFASRMTADQATKMLDDVLIPLCEIYPGPETMRDALQIHRKHQFSFYDALIIQSALEAECNILYSEDMQHGFRIADLEIRNPFVRRL